MNAVERWHWLLRDAPIDAGGFALKHLPAVVAFVAEVVPSAVASSITELDGGTYRTSVASSPLALDLDIAQYTSGEGPCMTAARDRQQQEIPDMSSTPRFPAFASAARQRDVRSSLSIPIRTAYHPAALNIYATDPDAFDEHGRSVADLLGRALTARMAGSSGTRPMSISESVRVAERRKLIRTAIAAASASGARPTEAFESLARRSSREGRSVFEIAAELGDKRVDLS